MDGIYICLHYRQVNNATSLNSADVDRNRKSRAIHRANFKDGNLLEEKLNLQLILAYSSFTGRDLTSIDFTGLDLIWFDVF